MHVLLVMPYTSVDLSPPTNLSDGLIAVRPFVVLLVQIDLLSEFLLVLKRGKKVHSLSALGL